MGSHFLAVWQCELSHALEELTACWKSDVHTNLAYRLWYWVHERVSGCYFVRLGEILLGNRNRINWLHYFSNHTCTQLVSYHTHEAGRRSTSVLGFS